MTETNHSCEKHQHRHHSGSMAERSGRNHESNRGLWVAIALSFFYMGIEILGGLWSNSLALLADSAHMATDVASMALALFVGIIASKKHSRKMSYGYYRAEVLGGFFSGVLIWIVAGFLLYEAWGRFQHPELIQGAGVFWIATVGLCVNGIALWILHGKHKDHLHIRGAYLHLLGDLLGSIGAMVSGIAVWIWSVYWVDPVLTLFFALLVIGSAGRLIWEATDILMESTPGSFKVLEVQEALQNISKVLSIHDLHIWAVAPGLVNVSVHMVCESPGDLPNVLLEAESVLKHKFQIHHTTIQVETQDHQSTGQCQAC